MTVHQLVIFNIFQTKNRENIASIQTNKICIHAVAITVKNRSMALFLKAGDDVIDVDDVVVEVGRMVDWLLTGGVVGTGVF